IVIAVDRRFVREAIVDTAFALIERSLEVMAFAGHRLGLSMRSPAEVDKERQRCLRFLGESGVIRHAQRMLSVACA
ncbi:MAG: hypothetical protein D6723_02940, partial [Acidobacteria bacterium]